MRKEKLFSIFNVKNALIKLLFIIWFYSKPFCNYFLLAVNFILYFVILRFTLKEMLGIYQPYEYSWLFLSNLTKYIWHFIKNIAAIVIHIMFVHFFGIGSVSSYFLQLKLLLDLKMRKKKEKQTFRPHMGALFSAINSKINSKFM